MQKKYKHLFFDLDRTLWDFDKSADETFVEIYEKYGLQQLGVPTVEVFHEVYTRHNNTLWDQYRVGEISKKFLSDIRFYLTMQDFGVDDELLGKKLGKDYVEISPRKVNLFPHAVEVLEFLFSKYKLHLITNGFSEVQETKLSVSPLGRFFKEVITSEEAGVKKPNPEIFEFALQRAGADRAESLMIGDDFEVDILGAKNVNIDQVFFDPEKKYTQNGSTFYIQELIELKGIL